MNKEIGVHIYTIGGLWRHARLSIADLNRKPENMEGCFAKFMLKRKFMIYAIHLLDFYKLFPIFMLNIVSIKKKFENFSLPYSAFYSTLTALTSIAFFLDLLIIFFKCVH